MSNLVINSYGLYGEEWEKFLTSLKRSFAILAGVEDSSLSFLNAGAFQNDWRRLETFFSSSECSAVWLAWYKEYGITFLSKIDEYATLLEDVDAAYFSQAVYMIDEANKSADRDFIFDMVADAIEGLYSRADVFGKESVSFSDGFSDGMLLGNIHESRQLKVEFTPSGWTGFFDNAGGCFYEL